MLHYQQIFYLLGNFIIYIYEKDKIENLQEVDRNNNLKRKYRIYENDKQDK